MCDRNNLWKRWLAQRDLKWNNKWNHPNHSKANSNVIIALFSTFGGLILLFLIWLYYEHRKSANITENCRRLGKYQVQTERFLKQTVPPKWTVLECFQKHSDAYKSG